MPAVTRCPQVACRLVARLVHRRLAFGSVASCVSSVRRVLRLAGVPDVTDHHSVRLVLRGAKRMLGSEQKQKPPLSPEHLLQLRAQLRFPNPQHIALWCGVLLGWWGLLRKSNIVGVHALRRGDVAVSVDGVRVSVRRSKTRQHGRPIRIFLPRILDGSQRRRPERSPAAHQLRVPLGAAQLVGGGLPQVAR
jgi:hypothetical protein